MQDQIIIRMPTEDDDAFSWIKLSSTLVSPVVERGSLDALAVTATGFKLIVLVSGSDVSIQRIAVPTQNKQRMLKAIPYANEDEIISDVESLHFSLGKIEEKDSVPVAIVALSLMDQWQALFQRAGLSVDVIMPDTMAVPLLDVQQANVQKISAQTSSEKSSTESQAGFATNAAGETNADATSETNVSTIRSSLHIVIENNAALFRAGVYDAFYVDLVNVNFMLNLWLVDHADNLPCSLIVWGDASSVSLDIPTAFTEQVMVEYKPAPTGLLGLLVDYPIDLTKNINLLQGDYSRREQIGKIWRPWRLAASLAGALFILQLGLAITQSSALEAEYAALKVESKKIYKDTFPDARRIVNPRRQMEQKLKELKGGNTTSSATFLSMLADTGAAFKSTRGLNLKSIRFKNNTLDVDLEVPNYEVLDALKQKLSKDGKHSVEIQSAVTRKNVVQGRLQIKGLAS